MCELKQVKNMTVINILFQKILEKQMANQYEIMVNSVCNSK